MEETYDDRVRKVAADLFAQCRGNPDRLAALAAQFKLAAVERATGGNLEVIGGVSFQSKEPFVRLSWGRELGQLDIETARGHAMLVLEACQNAVTDAALYGWATDPDGLGADDTRGAQLIDALRRYRSDRWGQVDDDVTPEEPS